MNKLNIQPYMIMEKHNIGIIGVITPDTKGQTPFLMSGTSQY